MMSFEHACYLCSEDQGQGHSDRPPYFLVQTHYILESLCLFTKSNYYVSLQMKHNFEMFQEIMHKNCIVKMHRIT